MSSIDQGVVGGRNSFGGFLGRIRGDSDGLGGVTRTVSPQPHLAFASSGKISQDVHIPARNDEETPPVYLSRLFEVLSKGVVASLLARNGDPFHLAVLKAYMQTFDFENDPMDMALRFVRSALFKYGLLTFVQKTAHGGRAALGDTADRPCFAGIRGSLP